MQTDTLLLRQVHPSFVQGDKISSQVFSISSQVFTPTPKDNGKLSVYNGEKFTPQVAYEHFTNTPNCKSIGVVAVSYQECKDNKLDIIEDNSPFEGHNSIDFLGKSTNEIKKIAQRLKYNAIARGWQYKVA